MLFQKKLPKGKFKTFSSIDKIDSSNFYFFVHQVHGSKIIELKSVGDERDLGEADGILVYDTLLNINKKNTLPSLLIKTADCLPIVILGEFGYAFLHAGWRGLQQKIIANSILKKIEPYYVFIGPSICKNCYVVSEEMFDYFDRKFFIKDFNENNFNENNFNKNNNKDEKKLYLDLLEVAKEQIYENFPNIDYKNIVYSKKCTFCERKFNSFRRDKNEKRNYNLYIP
ncbi:MAG: polyphenol oxidase family protein [Oligoflexia bacterium]|nr:polyphenol oxidase family protein [Oligoflexia bacterium]